MTTAVATADARYRTAPMLGSFQGVDRDAEIIRGVAIMQLGDIAAQDARKQFVDDKTLSQFAQMFGEGKGIKARFTHPDMSGDGLGKYLGQWKAPRIDGEFARADLHISPRSHDMPSLGDGGKYVLDLAESDPEMFGASMAVLLDQVAMKKERRADGYEPIRLRQLFAIDIVDTPALTRGGLFSADVDLPSEVSSLLDSHFAGVPESELRDRAAAYLDRYLTNRYGVTQLETESMTTTATAPAATQESIDAAIEKALAGAATKFGTLVDERITKALADLKPGDLKPTETQLERKRCSDLFATAKSSGLKDFEKIAQEAVDGGLSIETFKAGIADRLIAQNKLTDDTGEQPADPLSKYKAEYAKNRSSYVSMGLSESDYCTSRQVDEGAAVLAAGAGVGDEE